jgi:hypothetical protein
LDDDKSMKKVAEAVEAINRVKKFYADIMIKESKPLRHRDRDWARSLGRKVRTSLSPRKKSVSDVSQDPSSSQTVAGTPAGVHSSAMSPLRIIPHLGGLNSDY